MQTIDLVTLLEPTSVEVADADNSRLQRNIDSLTSNAAALRVELARAEADGEDESVVNELREILKSTVAAQYQAFKESVKKLTPA